MAKPRREGIGWSMRQQYQGQDLYVSGYKTSRAARTAMEERVDEFNPDRPPRGLGPHRTTLAQALQDYAMERLKFNKGAPQEANRINRYLRALKMQTVHVARLTTSPEDKPGTDPAGGEQALKPRGKVKVKGVHYTVTLAPAQAKRAIPAGLGGHRGELARSTEKSDALRLRLAATVVARIDRNQVQMLMDALRDEGLEAASIGLERAVLRRLMNFARTNWSWPGLLDNPASGLTMPVIANERNRVMSADEERRLDEAMEACKNKLVGPTMTLLTETAMRSSEPLQYAVWGDVDWQKNVLRLRDSKTDKRDVPLSPKAIVALHALRELVDCAPDSPLISITYEALKAAWKHACERAGVENLHLHDLRHTAATRLALWSGNVFLVQVLTGLKTFSQVKRYVNVKPSDVVAALHARQGTSDNVIEVRFPQHRKHS
jgi:integrase